MKEIKPFQIAIFAICIIGAGVGLYVFATSSGGGGGKEEVGAVAIWGTLPRQGMEDALGTLRTTDERFTKITYREVPAASFSSELANALAAGTGPDLVILSQEMLMAERGKLALISYDAYPKRTYVDAYVPIFELFLTEAGSYGVPLAVDPLVLYYNRSMLAGAGIATPPSTWEAVSGAAAVLTQRSSGGALTRSAIALGEYGNVRNARGILSLLLLQSGSPISVFEDGVPRMALTDTTSTFGATPAQSAVRFYAQFADPAKTVYSWNRSFADSRQAFLAGDLALYLGYASELPYLSEANPNLDFDMAAVPTPASLKNRMTYGVAYAFAIPKAGANPSGALATAYALGSGNIALEIAEGASMAPPHRAALVAASSDRYRAVYFREALTAKGWLSPAPARTDAIFLTMLSDIISGRRDVESALAEAENALNAAY